MDSILETALNMEGFGILFVIVFTIGLAFTICEVLFFVFSTAARYLTALWYYCRKL